MAVVYAAQIQTAIKQAIYRSDNAVTRGELIEGVTLELGIEDERVIEQLDKLDRRGEVYHVGDGGDAEVRVP
ncbi:hypothetical protein ABNG03_00135 [Halorubrum sp. RMP-47]|uniref:MarR family transcriptional regulator n=1 Tax=Halorubrum miltondacostae TaxID=3076378 RepID=A0ABD5LZ31_9EURY